MPAITLIVTNAGRAALVNAEIAGTNAVRIASAGLTASAFVPLATATVLPGEFARINGVAGDAVDPDTISLVLRDDSAAVYTLRGFGLFLDDGTLFAIHSQPTPILEKSANSTALIAVDVRFADINATHLTFGNANFLNPAATKTTLGVIEIATDAEAIAGADDVRAVTPAGIKAVLDNRFGAGAASTFVKTLLSAASAAAFRLVLGIKSAALKDEGHGGGLDADLLDGYQLRVAANSGIWPGVPVIGADGGMEVGQYIDFHGTANDPADYTVRLQVVGSNLYAISSIIWTAANDGAGSGLDADLLDGQQGAYYADIPARLGYTPYNAAYAPSGFGAATSAVAVTTTDPDTMRIGSAYHTIHPNNGYGGGHAYVMTLGGGDVPDRGFQLSSALGFSDLLMRARPSSWTRIWTAGNDGAGSGLDADLLDGQDGTYYSNVPGRLGFTPANRAGDTFTGQIKTSGNGTGTTGMATGATGLGEIEVRSNGIGAAMISFHRSGSFGGYFGLDTDNQFRVGGWSFGANSYVVWHAGNDGAGSGLDADLLDGRDATSFANASHQHGPADIAPAFYARVLSPNGYQILPGGVMMQWGQHRGFSTGEGTVYIPFPLGFTGQAWSIQATAINPSASNNRDTTIQIVSRDVDGFTAYLQNNGGGGANNDGFDWFAVGI